MIPPKWKIKHELRLPIEKIAVMRGLNFRRGVQGILFIVTIICGMFLFSAMSQEDSVGEETITLWGYTGLVTATAVFLSELYSGLEARREVGNEDSSVKVYEKVLLVEECSGIFVFLPLIVSSTYSYLYMIGRWELGSTLIPIGAYMNVLALLVKPKRNDVAYKTIIFITVMSSGGLIMGFGVINLFRRGKLIEGSLILAFAPVFMMIALKSLLQIRKFAAEVSEINFFCLYYIIRQSSKLTTNQISCLQGNFLISFARQLF